eukprot:5684388-Prorocentrum_lima.AAC.1
MAAMGGSTHLAFVGAPVLWQSIRPGSAYAFSYRWPSGCMQGENAKDIAWFVASWLAGHASEPCVQ